MITVVPDVLRDTINDKLTEAYRDMPEAEVGRETHFNALLAYFDEHGTIPDFTIYKK